MITKKFLIVGVVGTMLLNPTPAHSAGMASLNILIEEALKNNPQIQAAKQRYESAQARVTLTRSMADPMFEYGYDKGAAVRTFSVSQEVPFPTKVFLRERSARQEANSFEQEYQETERQVIKELKETYFQLFLDNKKIEVANENLALLKQFVEVANKKYSVNMASQQDVLKAQVEYAKLANQLVLLKQEKAIAQSLLNSLLNRKEDAEVETSGGQNNKELMLNKEEVLRWARENRPELKSFREMFGKAGTDFILAKQEYFPDFTVKYTREERDGGAGSWTGMVGVSVPLWFGKKNSYIKEAAANLEVAREEYKATENQVLFDTRSAFAKFDAAKNLVKIYETGVLPQAQAALETARLGYQSDKVSFLDLLDAQRTLREFEVEYFESLANLEMALANLERSTGTNLSR